MTAAPLSPAELDLVRAVFQRHPEVQTVTLFGSRAKGTHHPASDVDLAVVGAVNSLGAEALALELDDLPLPYRFEVQALAEIKHAPLLEHIRRVGIVIHEAQPSVRAGGET